jgi:hypothetical protein
MCDKTYHSIPDSSIDINIVQNILKFSTRYEEYYKDLVEGQGFGSLESKFAKALSEKASTE